MSNIDRGRELYHQIHEYLVAKFAEERKRRYPEGKEQSTLGLRNQRARVLVIHSSEWDDLVAFRQEAAEEILQHFQVQGVLPTLRIHGLNTEPCYILDVLILPHDWVDLGFMPGKQKKRS